MSDQKNTNSALSKTPIAIIGLAGVFPQAENVQEYWDNIVKEVDSITEVPPSRWRIEDYYDPDPTAPDKTYCKRGGFLPDINFNPMEFGLPPNILEVTDASQLLSLVVAKAAMNDAGYGEGIDFNRARTGVVLGVGGGQKLITPLTSRLQYPIWDRVLESSGVAEADRAQIIEKMKKAYIHWEENSFPGMLGNVISGRVANRLDLGGMNCVVDAACAASLAAIKMAVTELTDYRADTMITGGVDTDNSIFMYMSFSKTPAFSLKNEIRPFDADSDGMMIGEAVGMLVLKRLADAERDGDRIYAVIKGIGTSSDGRYKSIYAPRASGQAMAVARAYQDAGFDPATVGLVEAHGTGTPAGDPTEFAGLNEVFSHNNPNKQHIALGSVKSQIGHTKAAAGAASLIKTVLALHHRILPPTLNVDLPHPKMDIENTPFYLNTHSRPWLPPHNGLPRRAGVSAFGFGGTNFHFALEEYVSEHTGPTVCIKHQKIFSSPHRQPLNFSPNAKASLPPCKPKQAKRIIGRSSMLRARRLFPPLPPAWVLSAIRWHRRLSFWKRPLNCSKTTRLTIGTIPKGFSTAKPASPAKGALSPSSPDKGHNIWKWAKNWPSTSRQSATPTAAWTPCSSPMDSRRSPRLSSPSRYSTTKKDKANPTPCAAPSLCSPASVPSARVCINCSNNQASAPTLPLVTALAN